MNPSLSFPQAAAAARANARKGDKALNVMELPEVIKHFEDVKAQLSDQILMPSEFVQIVVNDSEQNDMYKECTCR